MTPAPASTRRSQRSHGAAPGSASTVTSSSKVDSEDGKGLDAGGQLLARRRLPLQAVQQVLDDADGRGNVVHGIAPSAG
jgi:hypothetical protein